MARLGLAVSLLLMPLGFVIAVALEVVAGCLSLTCGHLLVWRLAGRRPARIAGFLGLVLSLATSLIYLSLAGAHMESLRGVLASLCIMFVFPLLAALIGATSITAIILVALDFASTPVRLDHCVECGHDLTDCSGPRCPKCDAPFSPSPPSEAP